MVGYLATQLAYSLVMSSDHTKELKRRKVSSITTFDAVELIKHSWILLLPSKAQLQPHILVH